MEFCSAEMSFFVIGLLCMSQKTLLSRIKKISLAESFTNFTQSRFLRTKTSFVHAFFRCPQKIPIFTSQKLSFAQTFLLPPKATLFCPPLPISTTLNLLFAKNTAILLIFALTPYAVKPEGRTDSNHCRRCPAKLRLFAKPVT